MKSSPDERSPVHRVTLIPGDGIGPEVVEAARQVLEATGVRFEWDRQQLGTAAFEASGSAVPEATLNSIRERGVALKGPTSVTSAADVRSANVAMREALDLYATVRPCRSYRGTPSRFQDVDLVVVKMNTEDVYAGIDYPPGDEAAARIRELVRSVGGPVLSADAGIGIKPISRRAAERIARLAFDYARRHDRRRVTAVHKATLMRNTDGVFLEAAEVVAEENSEIGFDARLVDSVCEGLVTRPADYDVLVMPRQYGDIVSGIAASLIGGLGMAPGANYGDGCAVFEAAHGTAPRRAGQGRANPIAVILSGEMLLRYLGEHEAADAVAEAVAAVVEAGQAVSYDLTRARDPGAGTGTFEVAEAIAAALPCPR